jgi:hypothetical protein
MCLTCIFERPQRSRPFPSFNDHKKPQSSVLDAGQAIQHRKCGFACEDEETTGVPLTKCGGASARPLADFRSIIPGARHSRT